MCSERRARPRPLSSFRNVEGMERFSDEMKMQGAYYLQHALKMAKWSYLTETKISPKEQGILAAQEERKAN